MAITPASPAELAALGVYALRYVKPGQTIGLGSGHAAEAFIRALGERAIRGVPTSIASENLASEVGIEVVTLADVARIDLTFDGADEVDSRLNLIKGYGGALVREKVVASFSRRRIILVGAEKIVKRLGARGRLPVEILPFAAPLCLRRLAALGLKPEIRVDETGREFFSDNANLIVDCSVKQISNPDRLDRELRAIPGVVGTGLFIGMADLVLVAESGGKIRTSAELPARAIHAVRVSNLDKSSRSMSLPASVRADLERIFRAALDAVAPEQLVMRALAGAVRGGERIPALIADARTIHLLAVGKAAPGMAAALERALGARLRGGVAVIPKGVRANSASPAPSRIEFLEASHPIPDSSSVRAARAALDLCGRLGPGDLLIAAISGGASAMLAMPAPSISLADKVAVTAALLRAGASIREFNLVRKHLSSIKGGNLLRAIDRGAQVLSLIISDVPGNDPATIGSGLTAADPTTYPEAISVLKRHRGVWGKTPEPVRKHLEAGRAGEIAETVKPGDPALSRVLNVIAGDNAIALDGAARSARAIGYSVDRWRELRGEANDLGRTLAGHLCAITEQRLCVLAGGEPVVTVAGGGKGGRAQQCALALALELARIGGGRTVAALFAGTDGIDGPTNAAGAFAAPDTGVRAAAAGVDPEMALRRNDSYRVFEATGDLLVTGATGTNVSDLFIALVNY